MGYLLKVTMTLDFSRCRTLTSALGDSIRCELLTRSVKAMLVLASPCRLDRSTIRKLFELARTGWL